MRLSSGEDARAEGAAEPQDAGSEGSGEAEGEQDTGRGQAQAVGTQVLTLSGTRTAPTCGRLPLCSPFPEINQEDTVGMTVCH